MVASTKGPIRSDQRSNYEDIDKPASILVILRDLAEQRTPVFVRGLRSGTDCASTVVSVDGSKGIFLIDEVLPLDANRYFRTGLGVRITTKVREVDTSFKSEVVEASRLGSGLHALRVPEAVRRYQQRDYYRARCLGEAAVRLGGCEGATETVVTAELRNLSVGGVGLRLATPVPAAFRVGAVFHDCEIRLDAATVLHCSLEVRHLAERPQARFAIAGCRALDLDRPTQNALSRAVTRMELEQLTRRK
jgi:c-di-GMP-binding flagellar brake protein YcgR